MTPCPPHQPPVPPSAGGADPLAPASPYEAMTRQMVDALARDVAEIRSRLDQLFTLIAGSVLVELLLRLTGLG